MRAYVIADNRLADRAGWDRKQLAIELKELSVEPDFDVAITGFEIAGVDIVIGEGSKEAAEVAPSPARLCSPLSQRAGARFSPPNEPAQRLWH